MNLCSAFDLGQLLDRPHLYELCRDHGVSSYSTMKKEQKIRALLKCGVELRSLSAEQLLRICMARKGVTFGGTSKNELLTALGIGSVALVHNSVMGCPNRSNPYHTCTEYCRALVAAPPAPAAQVAVQPAAAQAQASPPPLPVAAAERDASPPPTMALPQLPQPTDKAVADQAETAVAAEAAESERILSISPDVVDGETFALLKRSSLLITVTPLGTGAFGSVKKGALEVSPDKAESLEVAVKQLFAERSTDSAFLREVNALKRLQIHGIEGVAQLVCHYSSMDGERRERLLVMKWHDGPNLDTVLHDSKHNARLLSPEGQNNLRRFAHHVASALARLHAVNLVHYDLKPANVVLTARPDELDVASAVIVDLGSALISAAEPGQTLSSTGTPEYMSPEVRLDEPLKTAKADVWSFGIMLWEMFQSWSDTDHGRPKPRALARDNYRLGTPPVNVGAIRNEHIRELTKRCLVFDHAGRATALECAQELFRAEDAAAKFKLDVDAIARFVDMRVNESETEYKCGRREMMLSTWRRITLMRKHLRDDLELYFTAAQIACLAACIRSGQHMRDSEQFGTLGKFTGVSKQGVALDDSMRYGIYLWRNRVTGQGYVGKIERETGSRRQRDLEHRRDSSTAFDKQLATDGHGKDGWECVSVAQTSSDPAGRAANARLEVLLVLLLNTYGHRDGFNSELGGVWGATKLHNVS